MVEDDTLHNVSYLFHRNGGTDAQYKLHITPNERRWWGVEPGRRLEVFDTDKGRISIQICYNIEFPELGRLAAERGAEIFFAVQHRRAVWLSAALAGTVGNLPDVDNMDIQYAQSGIVTPSDIPFSRDAVAAECTPNIETVIIEDVDLELLSRHRQTGNVLNWRDRRSDLYDVRLRQPEAARSVPALGDDVARPVAANAPGV